MEKLLQDKTPFAIFTTNTSKLFNVWPPNQGQYKHLLFDPFTPECLKIQ